MITPNAPIATSWIFVLSTHLPYEDKICSRHNILLAEILASMPNARKSLDTRFQEVFFVCPDLQWTHDRNSPHRSETNGIAERAVRRRVKEGIPIAMVQSGFPEEWWDCAMECYCNVRCIAAQTVQHETLEMARLR